MAKSLWQRSMDSAHSRGWTHCTKSTWHRQCMNHRETLGTSNYHTPLIRAELNLPRPLLAMAGAAELLSPVCGISSPVGIKEMGFIRPSCCIKRGNSSAVITTFSVPACSFLRLCILWEIERKNDIPQKIDCYYVLSFHWGNQEKHKKIQYVLRFGWGWKALLRSQRPPAPRRGHR